MPVRITLNLVVCVIFFQLHLTLSSQSDSLIAEQPQNYRLQKRMKKKNCGGEVPAGRLHQILKKWL